MELSVHELSQIETHQQIQELSAGCVSPSVRPSLFSQEIEDEKFSKLCDFIHIPIFKTM